MKKLFKVIISGILTATMALSVAACAGDFASETQVSDNGIKGFKIILNGHVEDESPNDPLLTPCYFVYNDIAVSLQTQYMNKIPNDTLGLYNLPSDQRYLVIDFTFKNGSSSDMNVNTSQIQVYADNVLCDQKYIIDDNIISSATVSSGRIGEIVAFFSVPKDAEKVEIEYEKGLWSETLKFEVQEEGEFYDEDVDYIKEYIDNYNSENNPEETTLEETPINVTYATSDSFYHSNSRGIDYTADLTIDGDYKTSWQDGRDDDAIGDTLTYNFAPSDIYKVVIVNGNRKDMGSFSKNNRLASATLTFYLDGQEVSNTTMEFVDDYDQEGDILELTSPVNCDCIVITIDEVYKGSDYQDTGIAEVMFYAS